MNRVAATRREILALRPPLRAGLGDEFGRDGAERVGLRVGLRKLCELLLLARVEAIAE
jgi:hypothetical protein